ncbi:MAG: hypothetical protein WEB58_15300 [Planctomycetaceae bacterium]
MNRKSLCPRLFVLFAFAFLLVDMPLGYADDAREKRASALPPVGSWVRYRVVLVDESGTEKPYQETIEWQSMERDAQGRSCRWIEIRRDDSPEKLVEATRLLVPEEVLIKDPNPLLQTVKMRQSLNGKAFSDLDLFLAPLFASAVLVSPGIKNTVEPLAEPKIVRYQPGNLSIAEEKTASHTWTRQLKMVDLKLEIISDFKYYTHPDVNAGFAEASVKLTRKHNGEVRSTQQMTYYLLDAGHKDKTD